MPTAHIFIGTSLDGFIARPDGSLDWLLPFSALGEDHGFDAFISDVDCVVMGRKTFDVVKDMNEWIYNKPVLVVSRTLITADIPARLSQKAEVVTGDPCGVMKLVERRGWKKVYIDGGEVIRSFLKEGFVESIVVSRVPVLIGRGVPLFGDLEGDVKLVHEGTRSWESGVVQSRYKVLKN